MVVFAVVCCCDVVRKYLVNVEWKVGGWMHGWIAKKRM